MDTIIDTWANEAVFALTGVMDGAGLATTEQLSARAVELGVTDDVDQADSIIGHHLSPVVGWVRLNASLGLPADEFFRDSWTARVDRAAADMRARWA